MLRPLLILSLVSSASAAFAAPVKLTGDELKAKLNGALVEMDTPLGTKIPVRFGTDGLVSGEAGELAALLGSEKDRGRWWVDGDRICSKWFRWFDAEPQCITVQQDGSRLFWKEDGGKTGTATLVEAAPVEKPAPEPPPTVYAKADPVGPASPVRLLTRSPEPARTVTAQPQLRTAQAEPLPLPIRGPQRKEAVRVAVVPPAVAVSGPQEPGSAVETASVITVSAESDDNSDRPMMRFGGAGLLEASTRLAGATSPSAQAAVPVPPAKVEASPAQAVSAKATSTKVQDKDAPVRVAALPKPSQSPASRAKPEPPAAARNVGVTARGTAPAVRDSWTTGPSVRAPGRFYRVRGVERRDVLNVRRGPSEHHAAVAHIPPDGRRVRITGACVGEWCPVRYRRATGWVHSFYLAEDQPRRGSASQVYLAQP